MMINNSENPEGYISNRQDFETRERDIINPEQILSPEEIEWCKKEAGLEHIKRAYLYEAKLQFPDDSLQLTVPLELKEQLEKTSIDLRNWTLASGSQFKRQLLQEVLPNINTTEPIGEENPLEIEKMFYSSPDHRYRLEDPLRHWIPVEIAKDKAYRTFNNLFRIQEKRGNIVAVDTMVFAPNPNRRSIKKEIYFQKPQTPEEAIEMIKLVNGKNITVITGIVALGERLKGFLKCIESKEETKIRVKRLSDEEIEKYVEDNWEEVKNVTGGIDYTSKGKRFIREIEGDQSNLKGLPQIGVYKCIAKLHLIQQEIMRQLEERKAR